VQNAQSTADLGFSAASLAQASATQAQDSANQARLHAQAADELANEDAAAAAMLNRLVSGLDDYKNEFEVDVFFPKGSADLDEAAIRDLANLADIAKSLNGYMIEIAGYSSKHPQHRGGSKAERRTCGYRRRLFPRQKHPATAHPRAGWLRQHAAGR
jgi:outer membrane protein OmpA-like peptidoglycan-associated protein